MSRLIAPIEKFATAATNNTLHGRSVYQSADLPGHNVFKGWSTWLNNGHRGVGDALDIAGGGWRTPVVAVADLVQTEWHNDASKLEVVYLEGNGITAVYAHINAVYEGTGKRWKQGETIGVLRGDLGSPHLHFELWVDGKVVAAQTPALLRAKMLALFSTDEPGEVHVIMPNGDPVECHGHLVNGRTEGQIAVVLDALHIPHSWGPPNTLKIGG